jgi:hypothetical protein
MNTICVQDLEELRNFETLFKEKGYCEETVRAARPNLLNMIVVKLNSGGLLLYCPVQAGLAYCRPEFKKGILGQALALESKPLGSDLAFLKNGHELGVVTFIIFLVSRCTLVSKYCLYY